MGRAHDMAKHAGQVARRVATQLRLTRWDWGLLLALALALLAAMPFLTRPGLPRETDAELHVYRAAELGYSLRGGVLYPRWAPNLYLGYGYPIFNYYAPLTYYLANLCALLPSIDIVEGVKGVFVLGLVAASTGTYLLGRSLFGKVAGVLAAACFVFSPYVVFIDPHARGDLAEHFAVCLLPLAFYSFDRLASGTITRWAFAGSVVSLAALVLSHNLVGLGAAGLLGAYWVWGIVFSRARRRRAGWGGLAFAVSAALVAFFWLPALLEWDAVNLVVTGPGHFDFRNHFLSPAELLAPSRILDLGATSPRFRFNLGVAQWALAVPGAIWLLVAREQRSRAFFPLAGLALGLLMVPWSKAIWEAIPPMAYLQFPWRLLGPTNLALAICVAGTVALTDRAGRYRAVVSAGGLGVVLVTALPVLYPAMWPADFGGTSPVDIIDWEVRSLAFGTTSTGDFVPKAAARVPMKPTDTLVASYAGPGPIDKVNRATIPEGTAVTVIARGPSHETFGIAAQKRFILRLYTFYFPGWRAWVDGHPVEIEVATPEGFITVPVPSGEHVVEVRFGDTTARTAGWVVSLVGLVVLLGVSVGLRTPRPDAQTANEDLDLKDRIPLSGKADGITWLVVTVGLFVLVKSWVIDPHDSWFRFTSPPGEAWAAQHATSGNFGGQIELLGYDVPLSGVRSGDVFPVVLYWRALRAPDDSYQSFVHLAKPRYVLWGQDDHLNPGGFPTTRWPLDKYVWDEYEVQVLPGTPPGEYILSSGLYLLFGNYRLPLLAPDGQVAGDSFTLGSVRVMKPHRPPRIEELGIAELTNASFRAAGVSLLGYSQTREQVYGPDDPVVLTLFWRADVDGPLATDRQVLLLDETGRDVWRSEGQPGGYAFGQWDAGDLVRDPVIADLRQVEDLVNGRYRFIVIVTVESGSSQADAAVEAIVPLGEIWIRGNTVDLAGTDERGVE